MPYCLLSSLFVFGGHKVRSNVLLHHHDSSHFKSPEWKLKNFENATNNFFYYYIKCHRGSSLVASVK